MPKLNRRADLVFRGPRVAVFVDGCYWHGCPQHGTTPATNVEYWATKIGRNMARDHDTNCQLEEAGWLVIRIWEHDDPTEAARQVLEAVHGRRGRRWPRRDLME